MMSDICSCLICRKEFSIKGIHTHYERTHLDNKHYSSGNNGKYDAISKNILDKYNKNPKQCFQCNEIISFENKANKFCNKSCSASYNNKKREENGWTLSIESRLKIAETSTGRPCIIPYNKIINCAFCNSEFNVLVTNHAYRKEKRFCSKSCSTSYACEIRDKEFRLTKTEQAIYRKDAKFRFSIKDYPDEFDFALLKQHGFYKAKNRGNNLTGVSRDHMVSVAWGWRNKVPPEHIAHPANCRLILNTENSSKGMKNHITYEELLARITLWNERYNLSCTITKFSVC